MRCSRRSSGLRWGSSSWLRSAPRPLPGRPSLPSYWNDVDAFRVRIEHDLGFAPFELGVDVGELFFESEVVSTVLCALAQHKRLDDSAKRLGGELLVGDEHGFLITHRYVQ